MSYLDLKAKIDALAVEDGTGLRRGLRLAPWRASGSSMTTPARKSPQRLRTVPQGRIMPDDGTERAARAFPGSAILAN